MLQAAQTNGVPPWPLCGDELCGAADVGLVAGGGLLPSAASRATPRGALPRNVAAARAVLREAFAEFEAQCREEREQHERAGQRPSPQKSSRWALYLSQARVRVCTTGLLDFVHGHPECRARPLSLGELRFLLLLQHFLTEDTADFYRPEGERRHNDTFEGFLTENGVNAQLVKDAHRSEWSVEGHAFSMQQGDCGLQGAGPQDRKRIIQAFQRRLVTALEAYILDFCQRRKFSAQGAKKVLQVVTTQMSQCGLANLDRSSQAARYFVSGQGLEQRTAYNISVVDTGDLGEALQLSLYCMKTGFSQFHTEETLQIFDSGGTSDSEMGPSHCSPSSYLYQYATLRFVPRVLGGPHEQVECMVIDALDEVHIVPPLIDGWAPL